MVTSKKCISTMFSEQNIDIIQTWLIKVPQGSTNLRTLKIIFSAVADDDNIIVTGYTRLKKFY